VQQSRTVIPFFLLVLYLSGANATPPEQLVADPNLIASAVQYSGTERMRAGDRFAIGSFTIGGFIEARNEPGFNQGLLPNHNWRGFVAGTFVYPVIRQMQADIALFTGLEHESSHATMGIAEEPRVAYRMIYDHWYRKSLLNGLPLGAQLVMFDELQRFSVRAAGTWYFLSKNTPELGGLDVAGSGGVSIGAEYAYQFGNHAGAFVSLYERYIFRGPAEQTGLIYESGDGSVPVQRMMTYPVINRSTTFCAAGGLSLPLFQSRRIVKCYLWYLHGNPYGYVDSRDERNLFGLALTIQGR
jgi:hypothetical protein